MNERPSIPLPTASAWELTEYYRRLKAAIIALEAAYEEGDLENALDDPERALLLGGEILDSYRRLLRVRNPRATAFRRNSIHALLEPVKELLSEPRRWYTASDATPVEAAEPPSTSVGMVESPSARGETVDLPSTMVEPPSTAVEPPAPPAPTPDELVTHENLNDVDLNGEDANLSEVALASAVDSNPAWWEVPSLGPSLVQVVRATGPSGEVMLRIDQAIAVRAWGIGLEIDDQPTADAVATMLLRLAIHRVAMDLRGLEDIERWLARRPAAGAASDDIHIVPDILGRRFEQLMLDILNEHEPMARRAPLVEDFIEKTDLRIQVPDLNRRRGARIQVTQTTFQERLEQKLARIRNLKEFIILSPRTLADALDHEEGMELLSPADLDHFWSSFSRPPMTVDEMAAGIKRIFSKAMDRGDEDPRGPIAFVPEPLRRLVVAYVTAEAYRSTSELRDRESRQGRWHRRRR